MKKRLNKKAMSPVISTVLLISLVIVIAAIIFLWWRSISQDAITKFGDTNIELVCEEVKFDAQYSGGSLSVKNLGTVPIYNMNVKISSLGSHETKDIKEILGGEGWPETGLNQGGLASGSLSGVSDAESITVIPILMGSSKDGKKSFECDEQYGEKIGI